MAKIFTMKLERISDNQIRCTLTSEDLASRDLKLSELAYGSEKAKRLFQEMMQLAFKEFGFEAEDIPLMIEAIPLNSGCIVLVITKVEDPEELDTRFSKFAPTVNDEHDDYDDDDASIETIDGSDASSYHSQGLATGNDVLELFNKLKEGLLGAGAKVEKTESKEEIQPVKTRIMSFSDLDFAVHAAAIIPGDYDGESALYKDEKNGRYLLSVSCGSGSITDFNKLCSSLTEYGRIEKKIVGNDAYMKEHYSPVIEKNAFSVLKQI